MRPVNLIPKEEQHGARGAMRGGPLAYILLGSLLAALVAVTVLVVTDNQIANHKAEIETLNAEIASAQTRATESAAYTQFHQVAQQRSETVANLANSRFDWEGVMRQLSLVLPGDIWLSNLTGTVKPGVSVGGAASIALREAIAGPALQIEGCGVGQDSVARFISSLKEMEGVTRVGLQSSELPTGGGDSGGESVSAGGNCQTQDFVAKFQIVVAFDAAPIPVTGGGESSEAAAVAPEAAPAEATSPEGEASEEGEGG